LDGARLFNAVVATGVPAAQWAQHFDTVSFCLSKGLGAPVGSLVCASAQLVHRIHRLRKMFGGGMRQAGILAAAGIYALEHHIDRLAEDHRNARRLAAGIEELGLEVQPTPETNMVMFQAPEPARFHRAIQRRQLLINPIDAWRFRAVLHLDVVGEDVEDALGRMREALAEP
jgi:threonine aldolase